MKRTNQWPYCQTRDVFMPESLMSNQSAETLMEKFILIEINRNILQNQIFPTNQYLSHFFKRSQVTITQLMNKLTKNGWLKKLILTDKEVALVLTKEKSLFSIGCLFCGLFDIPLDKHHYPIRKKDGGIDTVFLCPNCHRRFHLLAHQTFKITNKFKNAFYHEVI